MRDQKTNDIVITAMFVALVMAATYIGFPTPASMGGYVHFGTLVLLTISIKYGPKYGMIAGGIGMTLFDLFSPWIAWAPATFVIRILMGLIAGLIAYDKSRGQGENIVRNIIAIVLSSSLMIAGYFIFQAWILSTENSGGFDVALTSIPGNVAQVLVGFISLYLIQYLPKRNQLHV